MPNLADAVNHAHNHWYRPCADGEVWTPNAPVKVEQEARRRNLNPAEWAARFLWYEHSGALKEGLFLIPAAIGHPAIMKARGFNARYWPDKHFLCSWSDNKKDTYAGQTPGVTGLNDCSHFVSECLQKGGVTTWSLNAPDLVRGLRARPDTKTLCFQVDKEEARHVINSWLIRPGDVIAYSDWNSFRHATLFLGGRMIAMHAASNHPEGDPLHQRSDYAGANNWEASAHASHPKVTLIHFNYDDRHPRLDKWVHGWWSVFAAGEATTITWGANGVATWSSVPPANLQTAPQRPDGRGYWFATPQRELAICWQATGTLERFRATPDDKMAGFSSKGTLSGIKILA